MMKWQEYILYEFPEYALSKISILKDPELLVAEEGIFSTLSQRGYVLHDFNDKLLLRHVYEHQVRNTDNNMLIIVRDEKYPLEEIPYDIFKQARIVSVSIPDLFPRLNYSVVRSLDRKHMAWLFEARDTIPLGIMGEDKTCEFLLENIFSISIETINKDRSFLSLLFTLHCDYKMGNDYLLNYIAKKLGQKTCLRHWDVHKLVTSATNFFSFLQERWECYIKDQTTCETLRFRGPIELPFDTNAMRPRIFTLLSTKKINNDAFEGIQKVAAYLSRESSNTITPVINDLHRKLQGHLPSVNAPYNKWLEFAEEWANLTSLYATSGTITKEFKQLQTTINELFTHWLNEHYNSLASLPPQTPVMVHQIIRSISRKIDAGTIKKVALIVIDGLAFNQWITIHHELEKTFDMTTHGCFAWIPTLTSISRQAIFAGKVPALFAKSINTTSREAALWQQAWEENGFDKNEIIFAKSLGNDNPEKALDLIGPKTKICGFVIDTVDLIMHGMQLGNGGMHNQIHQWNQNGYLQKMIAGLVDAGFNVILTSDHGNIECAGSGKLQDGILPEEKGERVRIYSDLLLAEKAVAQYPDSFIWVKNGLPPEINSVMLSGSNAFITKGINTIAHGGCSIEEVIVPIVYISGKKD